jgi:hypothetical protein
MANSFSLMMHHLNIINGDQRRYRSIKRQKITPASRQGYQGHTPVYFSSICILAKNKRTTATRLADLVSKVVRQWLFLTTMMKK